MALISSDELAELRTIANQRYDKLFKNRLYDKSDYIVQQIIDLLNESELSIIERLKQVARTFKDRSDLKISLYVYNSNAVIELFNGTRITMLDIINHGNVLYKLSELFNEIQWNGMKCFRLSTRPIKDMPYGWREIMLHYYPYGLDEKYENVDPEMPQLVKDEMGTGTGTRPASPVSGADDGAESEEIHAERCVCRQCIFRMSGGRDDHMF
jgi:hypothetical protein